MHGIKTAGDDERASDDGGGRMPLVQHRAAAPSAAALARELGRSGRRSRAPPPKSRPQSAQSTRVRAARLAAARPTRRIQARSISSSSQRAVGWPSSVPPAIRMAPLGTVTRAAPRCAREDSIQPGGKSLGRGRATARWTRAQMCAISMVIRPACQRRRRVEGALGHQLLAALRSSMACAWSFESA